MAIHAYTDPGSGSLIIEALIAVIVAAPILLRQQIGRAHRRLRGMPEPTAEARPEVDS